MVANSESNLENEVNQVLAAWNPLVVPEFLAREEYRFYAVQIVQVGNDFNKISVYLKKLVRKDLGLGYDENFPEHRAEIEKIATQLVQVFNTASKNK